MAARPRAETGPRGPCHSARRPTPFIATVAGERRGLVWSATRRGERGMAPTSGQRPGR
jgi:hypothetical protein